MHSPTPGHGTRTPERGTTHRVLHAETSPPVHPPTPGRGTRTPERGTTHRVLHAETSPPVHPPTPGRGTRTPEKGTAHRVLHAETRVGLVSAPGPVLGTERSPVFDSPPSSNSSRRSLPDTEERRYRGRAPPVDSFTGEKPEIRFKNWLLSFYEASKWNRWSEEDNLMQLAGHLRGRACKSGSSWKMTRLLRP